MWLASPGSQCPCCRSTSAGTPWACHQPSEMNHHSTRTVRALPCFSFLCPLLCMDAHDSELMILQFGDFLGSMPSPPSSSFIIPYANRSLKTYINTLLANRWELWDKYTRPRLSSMGKIQDPAFPTQSPVSSLRGWKKQYCIKNSRNRVHT